MRRWDVSLGLDVLHFRRHDNKTLKDKATLFKQDQQSCSNVYPWRDRKRNQARPEVATD